VKAVFGLGNPGANYRRTRHNLGFMVIDRYLDGLQASCPVQWAGRASVYRVNEDLLLVKPLTYMNRSGLAVSEIVKQFRLDLEDCLIIYDDCDIPMGELRARTGGGAGGHRGMESIIEELGTEEIPRLRVGIGKEGLQGDLSDYVLSSFTVEELEGLGRTLDRAAAAIPLFHKGGVKRMMDELSRPESA
jgi:PTH1 family peptidyl-tRNA hydrolase